MGGGMDYCKEIVVMKKKGSVGMTQRELFCRQKSRHPSMEAQDWMKLCFQAAFGAEHLALDPAAAQNYLREEFERTPAGAEPLYEEVSEETVRVNLGAWKREGLPEEWLLRMFLQTAENPPKEGERRFRELTELVTDILREGQTPAGSAAPGWTQKEAADARGAAGDTAGPGQPEKEAVDTKGTAGGAAGLGQTEKKAADMKGAAGGPAGLQQWEEYLTAYPLDNPQAVHHSENYRAAEKPAYRLVCRRFLRIFPVLRKLAGLQAEKGSGSVLVAALDGRSASGKTTLADQLQRVAGASVIHMDDFFLPGELRTPERLAEPGGNVHYERFAEEVLPFLRKRELFSYRVFDCGKMALGEERLVPGGELRIVEGAYSCHPKFGEYMDLRVFCDVESGEQERRILARNGAEMLGQFRERWIPLEERYFASYGIREQAEILL